LRVKNTFYKLKKIRKILLVGAPGFEPGTSCAQGLSARGINELHRALRIAIRCDKCNATDAFGGSVNTA
jgi:hypothetical protein